VPGVLTRSRDSGFSLVELLVVMLLIGLLAAIAVPVLVSQREKAGRAAMVSDLRSLRTAQEARGLVNDPRYTDDPALLRAEGWSESDGVTTQVVLVDGDDAYLACVTHDHVDEWLVFSSVAGTTSPSPVSCGP